MPSNWKVLVEPEGRNPGPPPEGEEPPKEGAQGTNQGGMVVYLTGAHGGRHEVARVAWVRRNSKNPDTAFEEQLRAEVDKAKKAVEVMEELTAGASELA
jgi:hypothetical protein